ncbi:MAG: hypothetical protein WC091_16545 [Sulfuricellaceae bacterium]
MESTAGAVRNCAESRNCANSPMWRTSLVLPDKALQGMADSGKIRLADDRLQLPDFAA